MGSSALRAGFPAPEQAPTLPMPAHHRVRGDEHQVLTPAGAASASEHPQYLVPAPELPAWMRPSGTSQDSQLMAQQQVLEHEILARTHPGQDGREQQPQEFEHAFSMADYGRPTFASPQQVTRDHALPGS